MLELSDEQREIQALCREFAAKEIRPISLAVDEADIEWPRDVWRKASEIGLTSFMLPACRSPMAPRPMPASSSAIQSSPSASACL